LGNKVFDIIDARCNHEVYGVFVQSPLHLCPDNCLKVLGADILSSVYASY